MLQESTQVQKWDPVFIDQAPSAGLKIYNLFLVVACIVALFKLIRVWRFALPFNTKRPTAPSAYLKLLQASASSLIRWIGLTFLAGGLLASTTIFDVCNAMLGEKVTGRNEILLLIRDFSTALSPASFAVLFLYLARWHTLIRIEQFRD